MVPVDAQEDGLVLSVRDLHGVLHRRLRKRLVLRFLRLLRLVHLGCLNTFFEAYSTSRFFSGGSGSATSSVASEITGAWKLSSHAFLSDT